jgi:hypothetical protein
MYQRSILIVGSIGVVVGSFLPWATQVVSTGARFVQGAIPGDGVISAVFGGLLLILAFTGDLNTSKLARGIGAALSALVIAFGIQHIVLWNNVIARAPEGASGSLEPGLWILTSGGVLYLAVVLLAQLRVMYPET